MNHTDIIIIVVTLTITSTLGTYVAIKLVNQYMRPVTNVLHRRNDIELANYADPTHPQQIYNYPELLPQPYPCFYERISNVPSYSTGNYGRPPTYLSGNSTLPSYQPIDRLNINSSLENGINLDYILWIILFLIIFYFLLRIIQSRVRYEVIRIISILVIIFILFNNFSLISFSTTLVIPFSVFNIDFRDSFEWKFNSWKVKPIISYFKLQTLTKDLDSLLFSLEDNINYSMSFSFIRSYTKWNSDKLKNNPILIEDAIIVNRESDLLLITDFIMFNLDDNGLFISNSLLKDFSINTIDPLILVVTVPISVNI